MDTIDSFGKRKEKGEVHTTPPPKGHAVAEILQDKNNSHLFGKLLERDGQEDLAARIVAGNLEQDDIDLLSEYRIKFSEKMAQSEKIEKLLTEENVIEIARTHPDFAKIIDIVTPKQAIKVVRDQLRKICFTDEVRFNEIAEPIEAYDSYKNGEYKKTNDAVEKLYKDMGITQKEYLAALAIEDPEEKKAALEELAKGKYGKWQNAWNIISGKNTANFRDLKNSETLLESSIAELDVYKGDIGEMLFLSISDNDDMRSALSRELLSENMPVATEKKTGFPDVKNDPASTLNEREFDTDWETFKKREDYGALFDYEQDAYKDRFIEEQKTKYREKNTKNKGFWASIFAAWLEGNINSKRDILK